SRRKSGHRRVHMAPTSRRSTTTFRPTPTRRVQRNVDSDHDDSVVLDSASSDDGSDNDDNNWVRANTYGSATNFRTIVHPSCSNCSFFTPDMCNSTHDCSVGTGDAFLQTWEDCRRSARASRLARSWPGRTTNAATP